MAYVRQLPCDGDGICLLCKLAPSEEETLTCATCVTPWHVNCLSVRPKTLASTLQWNCPDCTSPTLAGPPAPTEISGGSSGELISAVRAIEADASLTEVEKARRRQELLSGGGDHEASRKEKGKEKVEVEERETNDDVLGLIDENLKCSICIQLLERPVTTPCGHNFCLRCFQKWIGQGKNTCAKCRHGIPSQMVTQPRINSALVAAIRTAIRSKKSIARERPQKVHHHIHNENRPDKAYTTERAQKKGMANAACGRILVNTPNDHFGPILAENDPERKRGVLVGDCWDYRMDCRQWGIHYPPVAGIAGRADCGAQSVVLSGGYEDDEDHGEWFLYTGSGGRNLEGNKRTNKKQSFDQAFESSNEALRLSCKKGYPVRVVRSHKEKRSSYAPEKGFRYDGVYRIEKCWRKVGTQGYMVCRYLFVRCDNGPAPWTSDENGDQPRTVPAIPELEQARDMFERKENPSWDYDEEDYCWKWKKPPPPSKATKHPESSEDGQEARHKRKADINAPVKEKLLKEFKCLLCSRVMTLPLTTPCAHNFCKPCLEGKFAGQTFTTERSSGGRTLRLKKNVMKCPACSEDLSEFLQNPQVNREVMEIIESLQKGTSDDGNTEGAAHKPSRKKQKTSFGASSSTAQNEDKETLASASGQEEEKTDNVVRRGRGRPKGSGKNKGKKADEVGNEKN